MDLLAFALAALGASPQAAAADGAGSTAEAAAPAPGWTTEIVLRAPDKLGSCAVGDLDARAAGAEIAAVSRDGSFLVARRGAQGWEGEVVFRSEGEMIQCATGDLLPGRPGLELLAVGMRRGPEEDGGPGAAYVVRQEEGRWVGELVHESPALLHAACAHEGAAFVAGYANEVHRLQRTGEGWSAERVATLPGAGKAAVSTPAGVVVACTDGSLVLVARRGAAWEARTIDRRESGRARLGTDGAGAILASDDDGTLSLVRLEGGERRVLHRSTDKLRGAVLADLDPSRPGLEAATAGYSREVVVLHAAEPVWRASVPFVDAERLHHLAAGNLDGDPAAELVACGYSGLLVLLDLR